MRNSILIAVFSSLVCSVAHAGFIEIGGSGSYRRSNIAADTVDESKSISGSLSYYFSEASALELSYTEGTNRRDIAKDSPTAHLTHLYYSSIGLDFVYTFGSRESGFRPYVKAGGNYFLKKRVVDQQKQNGIWGDATVIETEPALVPTAGLGFKLGLTEQLSLKAGVDAWSSQPLDQEPFLIDFAGRAGLSWLF
jgi:outer membrane protein W